MTNHPSLKEKTAKGLLWGAMNSTLMQILNAVIGVVLGHDFSYMRKR